MVFGKNGIPQRIYFIPRDNLTCMKKKSQTEREKQAQEIQLPEWVRIVDNYLREVEKIKGRKRDKND